MSQPTTAPQQPLTAPVPDAMVLAAASLTCPECQALPAARCTTDGIHLARFALACQRRLISRSDLGVIIAAADAAGGFLASSLIVKQAVGGAAA